MKTIKYVLGFILLALLLFACDMPEVDTAEKADEVSEIGEFVGEDGQVYRRGYLYGSLVTVLDAGDCYLYQGDISISKDKLTDDMSRGAFSYSNNLWPGGIIPFFIDTAMTEDQRESILEAVGHWNENVSSIHLIEMSSHPIECPDPPECPGCEPDCIKFTFGETPRVYSSDVGMTGGIQKINLLNHTLSIASIVHEIGHAVGLKHEHTRSDRDAYIRLHRNNWVDPDIDFSTNMNMSIGPLVGEFDFESIMLYSPFNGNYHLPNDSVEYATITKIGPGGEDLLYYENRGYVIRSGQFISLNMLRAFADSDLYGPGEPQEWEEVYYLSEGDIEEVNTMYGIMEACPIERMSIQNTSGGSEFLLMLPDGYTGGKENVDFMVADYNRDGTQDILAILRQGTASNKIELVVFDGRPAHAGFSIIAHYPLWIYSRDDLVYNYDFIPTDWNEDGALDLIAIMKTNRSLDNKSMRYRVIDGNPPDSRPYNLNLVTREKFPLSSLVRLIETYKFLPCMKNPSDPEYNGFTQAKGIVLTSNNAIGNTNYPGTKGFCINSSVIENDITTSGPIDRNNIVPSDNIIFRMGYLNRDYSPDLLVLETSDDNSSQNFSLKICTNKYTTLCKTFEPQDINTINAEYELSWWCGQPDDFLVMDLDGDSEAEILLLKEFESSPGSYNVSVRD